MHLLVAGAGDVGSRVATRVAAMGWRVTSVRRTAVVQPQIHTVQGNLYEPAVWLTSLPAVDAVLWCPAPDQRTPQAYRALYQDALLDLLDTSATPPARIVFASSTAVYAEDGGLHAEDSSRWSAAWNGVALGKAEQALQAQAPHAVVARLGGIYGPGRTWLLRRARAGEPVQRDPPRWTNRIHVDDAAAALAWLLTTVNPPRVVNVVDSCCTPEHVVLDWLAARLGVPAPPTGAGQETGKRVIPQALLDAGFVWRYPDFRAGYAALLEETSDGTAG